MYFKCMAVKTISIDMEAYDLLARHKRVGTSFSDVIKKQFGPKKTASSLLEALSSMELEDSTLDQFEKEIKARKRHPARVRNL